MHVSSVPKKKVTSLLGNAATAAANREGEVDSGVVYRLDTLRPEDTPNL